MNIFQNQNILEAEWKLNSIYLTMQEKTTILPTILINLKSKVDKLHVDKLIPVSVDLY